MGCSQSMQDANEQIISRMIDQDQQEAQRSKEEKVSLLLLGAGESGKTTIMNQWIRLYANAFEKDEERKEFGRPIVHTFHSTTLAVLEFSAEENSELLARFQKALEKTSMEFLSAECAAIIEELFFKQAASTEAVFKQYYHELQVPESFPYFLKRFKEYPQWAGSKDWVPSVEDCIRTRSRTSGVMEVSLTYMNAKFELYDVGGQRSERRKYLHSFQSVTAVVFVVNLADYDQVLYEDRNKNRLEESLDLFKEVANSRWLADTPILLFLNKRDLFVEKFVNHGIKLNQSGQFPMAPTGNDENQAIAWIENQFKERQSEARKRKPWFSHVCTATDPSNMDNVMRDCSQILFAQLMANAGLYA